MPRPRHLPVVLLAFAASALACGASPDGGASTSSEELKKALTFGEPDEVGMDSQTLVDLAEWIRTGNQPLLSLLISKNGKVVFELYTSSLTRDHAHYLMSVTKSVTSALVGVAINEKILGAPTTSVTDALPPEVFATPADRARFESVTIRDVLGMSALDAQVPPHRDLPEDEARLAAFNSTDNRLRFALKQAILPKPGVSFQYTDVTPILASGMLEYASGQTAFDYANAMLFDPMGFENQEWMHADASGIDNGAYGLRLRPVDMQRFGILYLRRGNWQGRQLLPSSWVDQSFTPWIKSDASQPSPNYGWYWWTQTFAPHWTAHLALGWKGQRIAVIPEQNVVVTMTAIEEDPNEPLFGQVMSNYVIPATSGRTGRPPHPDASLRAKLHATLESVRTGPSRIKAGTEPRMVPSIAPKEAHPAFSP